MLRFTLPPAAHTVLCLGAHSDDIEIGCGGTIAALLAHRPDLTFHGVVFSAAGIRADEARASALALVGDALAGGGARTHDFRDGFFPYEGGTVKECFEDLKRELSPDLVFTHHRQDRHQDHRLVSELTWNTFRSHLILEYEVPKYDGDLQTPNCYVPLSDDAAARKMDHLLTHFPSQAEKSWFSAETFRALLRLRGIESGAPEPYAEAFHVPKVVLGWTSEAAEGVGPHGR